MDNKKWPPRLPDLNPCDFFWGYLNNSKVYNPQPKTLEDLKQNIRNKIETLKRPLLESTFNNMKKRLKLVIAANGGHIKNK